MTEPSKRSDGLTIKSPMRFIYFIFLFFYTGSRFHSGKLGIFFFGQKVLAGGKKRWGKTSDYYWWKLYTRLSVACLEFLFPWYVHKNIRRHYGASKRLCCVRNKYQEYIALANSIFFSSLLTCTNSLTWSAINSIVVDDVDGDCDNNGGSHYYSDSHHHHQFYIQHQTSSDGQESNEVFDDNADARSDISQCSRGSRGSTSREESETRLQQIKASLTQLFVCSLEKRKWIFTVLFLRPQGLLSIYCAEV